MNLKHKIKTIFALAIIGASTAGLGSCSDDNGISTRQYHEGVALNVFGPCPVARGGELRFLGSGLDQITSVTVPGSGEISEIKVLGSNEIRITVPQDAEPGYIELHHAKGNIKTKTLLSFTEPISLESFSPATVRPGDDITITGEYLNLIHEVIFCDGVAVAEESFKAHQRDKITLTVPMEAQSGKIIISDAAEMPNWIYSAEDLTVVLPSVDKVLDITKAKPGDEISVAGKDLDLVEKVLMPSGDEVPFKTEDNKLIFILPENATDGTIVMIPASGVEVAVATIGVAVPENVTAEPADGLWAGDILKLKGINMELVSTVTFPNVESAVKPTEKSSTEISVKVPAGTQSGELLLTTGSGAQVGVEISTKKAEVTGFNPNPAAAGAPFSIIGKNLDLVTKVTFKGGVTIDVQPTSAVEFKVDCPLSAQPGDLTLTMTNGETVTTEPLEIDLPLACYIVEMPSEDTEIKAGEILNVGVANSDKLTNVLVNGTSVQFILNSDRLFINLPNSCGANTIITLVSSNGSLDYTFQITPATHVSKTIHDSLVDLKGWGEKIFIPKSAFEGVPAGAILTFHVAPYSGFQIQLNDCNWSSFDTLAEWNNWDGMQTISYELTGDILNRLLNTFDGWSDNALIIQGDGTVISKITLDWENSLEETIWSGSQIFEGWSGWQDLAWGGYDWSQVKPNSTVKFYFNILKPGEWAFIGLRHGMNWGDLPHSENYSQIDLTNETSMEFKLPADVLKDIVDNGGVVVVGANINLTKITIQ